MTTTCGVYLICFRDRNGKKGMYKHAGHYLGYTGRKSGSSIVEKVRQRLSEHRSGNGAALTRAASSSGMVLSVSRVWDGADKNDEWRLRQRAENTRLCPFCNDRALSLATAVGDGGNNEIPQQV